ncbi:metallopeptidase family protein [Nocardioides pantholopis]|uniref:metallopeptidase family protein n=1 Tax=Nocardioides pantholopis TaxID=2483798 RepID=UPI001F15057A|nr:metallopeptidase family protein [Nocardioides pantholopis]
MDEQRAGPAPRGRRSRDRRGRGMRGPGVLPRTPGTTAVRTSRQRFDDLVLGIVTDVDRRWQDRLGLVEYAVEDTPQVPDDWDPDTVPLSSLVRGQGTRPTRLVLFRRPIEHRCESRSELEALVLTLVVEQVAELLGIDAADVDPRYDPDD